MSYSHEKYSNKNDAVLLELNNFYVEKFGYA